MKRYLSFGIIIAGVVMIFFVSFKNSRNEKGFILFNSNKSFVAFVPVNNLNINICGSAIEKLSHLEGFQFKYIFENSNQFFQPQCHIITGAQSEEYPSAVTNWYISKCNIKFSYKESIFNILFLRPHYETFAIKKNNEPFIKFKYTFRNDIYEVELKEIK